MNFIKILYEFKKNFITNYNNLHKFITILLKLYSNYLFVKNP